MFVSASSLGPYGFRRDDEALTERSTPDIGPLSRDALELEACALEAEALGTASSWAPWSRACAGRRGIPAADRAFRRGLGAPVSPGTQWCSWIHIADAES